MEDVAATVIRDMRAGGNWSVLRQLETADLSETLRVIADYDRELLVAIAADAVARSR